MNVPSISAPELAKRLSAAAPPIVIDVRREPAFLAADDMLRGALRRDPADVAMWGPLLIHSGPVVVYCVHGHEVSQGVASALIGLGIDARFLGGGIEVWREAGGALDRKQAA